MHVPPSGPAAQGNAFDRDYIHGQIVDHQMTAQLLGYEIGSGEDPQLKAFASQTLPVVLQHLRMAQRIDAQLSGAGGPQAAISEEHHRAGGHLLQMQVFGQDSLNDDLSKGGNNGWSLTSDEFDSGATTEGWASYIGVVSWYEPNNPSTNPVGWGVNFEAAAPTASTCSGNRGIPLQVARAFWDLDDWNNEAGGGSASDWSDRLAYSTLDIVRGWQHFADGTGNRQKRESGSNGVNMRDYYWNNTWWFADPAFMETFLQHNCLQDQDNN